MLEKFGISNSWLFKTAKENNFPKITQRGKILWSKPHIDRFFAKSATKEEITEWYTAAELQERYGMTLSAIYTLVSKESIPKKKVGCEARYSKWHFDKAKGVAVDEPDTYTMQEAFRSTKGAFYRGAEYASRDKEWFELEGKKIRFDDYCAFMGHYLSDGCLQHDTGIVIAQQAGCFAFYNIVDIVAKMGYNITFTPDMINIYNTALNRYLSQFGVCNKKFIPDEIKNASKRQIQIFLDAFIKCDGHARKCKSFIGNHGNAFHSDKEERMYFTTSERLAGDLSELILKVGHRPSFEFQEPKTSVKRDGSLIKSNYLCYRIRECYSTTATVFKKEYLPYSGKVYDLTLDRNHIMYVRRNGKCFWGSNCMCYTIPILKTEDEFFDDDEDAKSVNEVEDVPKGFKEWVKDNKDRIKKAEAKGSVPYFIADNRETVTRILKGESTGAVHEAARIEANRQEYERLKADPNYTDVEFNPKNGGLRARHTGHIIHNKKNDPRFFSPENLTSTDLELTCQSELYRLGKKCVLLQENIKAADDNKLPALDALIEGVEMDIRSITVNKEHYGAAIKAKIKQLNNFNTKNNKSANTICLYFHDPAMYANGCIENGLQWIRDNFGSLSPLKEIWIVIKGKGLKKINVDK